MSQKQELITKVDSKELDFFYQQTVDKINFWKKNTFELARYFSEMYKNKNKVYKRVKSKLVTNKILDNTTIKYFAYIGETRNGFLLNHQNKLPMAVSTLKVIRDVAETESGYIQLQDDLKKISLENYNSRDIQEKYKKYLKKNMKSVKKASGRNLSTKRFENDSGLYNSKHPTIVINISQKILKTSPKKVVSDLRTIQRIFQYADIITDKHMSDLMLDDVIK